MKRKYLALLTLFACGGKSDEPEDDGIQEVLDGEAVEVVGSITVAHWPQDARYAASGDASAIFVKKDKGILNLADCVVGFGTCMESVPSSESGENPNVDSSWMENAKTFDAGTQITVGGYNLTSEYDDAGKLVYVGDGGEMKAGMGGLSWNGELAAYDGTDDFTWAGAMVATAPDPTLEHEVGPGDSIDFAWEAGGAGDVVLQFNGTFYGLEDDGAFTLALDDVQWTDPFDGRIAQLARWNVSEVDAAGNQVKVLTMSEQWYYIQWANTEGWTELADLANTCEEASDREPLATADYYGTTEGFTDDLDLGADNVWTEYETPGPDGIVPLAVTEGETVTLSSRLYGLDNALYLLSDCGDISAATVLAAVDNNVEQDSESLTWTATYTGTAYVVLDGWEPAEGGLFTLEVAIE